MTIFVGLTGSIGMGKSTTAQMFRDLGVPVHDSDQVVHDLYRGRAAPLLEAEFPGVVVDGAVDRERLGAYVVGQEEAMKRLEAIVHPLVRQEEINFRKSAESTGAPIAVLDIPLLFETGRSDRFDAIVVVTAPAEVQRERVLARPGMSEEKFDAILSRQVPDAQKREMATHIVDSSKGLENARKQVISIIEELTGGS